MVNTSFIPRESEKQYLDFFNSCYDKIILNRTKKIPNLRTFKTFIKTNYPFATLVIQKCNNHLYLHKIGVNSDNRGTGIAKSVLTTLCNFADLKGITIKLQPTIVFGCEFDRLVNFYYSFGFNWDSEHDEMVRIPKNISILQ